MHFAAMDTSGVSAAMTMERARRADRRDGLHALVRLVSGDLLGTNARTNLAASLIERLSRLGRIRSVRLNEISLSSPAPVRSMQPIRARDYVAYSVPVRDPGRQLML